MQINKGKYLLYRRILLALAILGLLIGHIVGLALLSVSLGTITVLFLTGPHIKSDIQYIKNNPGLLFLTFPFFLYLISGIWSDNLDFWWNRVQLKIVCLGAPLSLVVMREFKKKTINLIFTISLVLVSLTALWIMYGNLTDQSAYSGLSYGKTLSSPINHIRFSLLVVVHIFIGLFFLVNEKKSRIFHGILLLFLVVFIHYFAVRTGIAAFYLGFLAFLLTVGFTSHKKLLIPGLLILILAPSLSFLTMPTLRDKVNYMQYDVGLWLKGESSTGYSDGKRLNSIKAGLLVFRSNPVLGVGIGDIHESLNHVYSEMNQFTPENGERVISYNTIVHNQFVFIAASTGIIGLLGFIFSLLLPFFKKKTWRNPLFLSIFCALFLSLMVEPTLEVHLGLSIFYVFLTMAYIYPDLKDGEESFIL